MSKAEDRALDKYPIEMYEDVGWRCVDKNADKRKYFVEGYHQAEKELTDKAKVSSGWDGFYYGQGYKQAEKDLELTWEDMFNIFRLVNEVFDDYAEGKTKKEVGEEVLRRFKERKEKCTTNKK